MAAATAARPAGRPARGWLLIAPALALIAVFFLLPYANMLLMSFFVPAKSGPYEPVLTLGNYAAALGDPFQWQVLARTLKLGFLTTAITLVLGYPLAWNLARASGRLKGALLVLLLSPLLVGVVIRSFGWMVLLADNGLVNSVLRASGLIPEGAKLMYNELGVLVGTVHIYLPFMVLSISGALEHIATSSRCCSAASRCSPRPSSWCRQPSTSTTGRGPPPRPSCSSPPRSAASGSTSCS